MFIAKIIQTTVVVQVVAQVAVPLKLVTLVALRTQMEIHAVIHSQVLKQTQITNTTNCLFSL